MKKQLIVMLLKATVIFIKKMISYLLLFPPHFRKKISGSLFFFHYFFLSFFLSFLNEANPFFFNLVNHFSHGIKQEVDKARIYTKCRYGMVILIGNILPHSIWKTCGTMVDTIELHQITK
jgi:hypothetical protein